MYIPQFLGDAWAKTFWNPAVFFVEFSLYRQINKNKKFNLPLFLIIDNVVSHNFVRKPQTWIQHPKNIHVGYLI